MLKFGNLSLSQQKCIVAIIEADPSLKKTGRITLKEVNAITKELASKRSSGAPKIGYPNWLFAANKVERGVYQLPLPTEDQLSGFTKAMSDKNTPKVAKAKAKVAKLAKAKTVKVKVKPTEDEDSLEYSRLQKIVDDSASMDEDVEDFNQILRENGITV